MNSLEPSFFQICWTLFPLMNSRKHSFITDFSDIVSVDELNGIFFYFRFVGHCLCGWTHWSLLLFQICWTMFPLMKSLKPSFILDLLDNVSVDEVSGTFFYFRSNGHCLCWWTHWSLILFQICWTLFTLMNSLKPYFISDLLDIVVSVDELTGTFIYFRFFEHCLRGWTHWNLLLIQI